MECSLRFIEDKIQLFPQCLNPYFNGMLTWKYWAGMTSATKGLNPYSNGMLTWEKDGRYYIVERKSLNPYSNGMLT